MNSNARTALLHWRTNSAFRLQHELLLEFPVCPRKFRHASLYKCVSQFLKMNQSLSINQPTLPHTIYPTGCFSGEFRLIQTQVPMIQNTTTCPDSSSCLFLSNTPASRGKCGSDYFHLSLAYSRTAYKWNHSQCTLLCSASFIQHNVYRVI